MRSTSTLKQYIHQINFNSLDSISQDEIEKIKRCGSVLIRDVVDNAQAVEWKDKLKEFVCYDFLSLFHFCHHLFHYIFPFSL